VAGEVVTPGASGFAGVAGAAGVDDVRYGLGNWFWLIERCPPGILVSPHEAGVARVPALGQHTDAILGELGIQRLRKSVIDELITTDSVARPAIDGVNITTLSVAGLLGEAIKRIHRNESVSRLFR
jgi:hypothetical protein